MLQKWGQTSCDTSQKNTTLFKREILHVLGYFLPSIVMWMGTVLSAQKWHVQKSPSAAKIGKDTTITHADTNGKDYDMRGIHCILGKTSWEYLLDNSTFQPLQSEKCTFLVSCYWLLVEVLDPVGTLHQNSPIFFQHVATSFKVSANEIHQPHASTHIHHTVTSVPVLVHARTMLNWVQLMEKHRPKHEYDQEHPPWRW